MTTNPGPMFTDEPDDLPLFSGTPVPVMDSPFQPAAWPEPIADQLPLEPGEERPIFDARQAAPGAYPVLCGTIRRWAAMSLIAYEAMAIKWASGAVSLSAPNVLQVVAQDDDVDPLTLAEDETRNAALRRFLLTHATPERPAFLSDWTTTP